MKIFLGIYGSYVFFFLLVVLSMVIRIDIELSVKWVLAIWAVLEFIMFIVLLDLTEENKELKDKIKKLNEIIWM